MAEKKLKRGSRTAEHRDALIAKAWSLWVRGTRNISQIATACGIQWKTADKYIRLARRRYEQFAAGNAAEQRAQILGEYDEVKRAAWREHARSGNDAARVGALRVITDTLKAESELLGLGRSDISLEVTDPREVVFTVVKAPDRAFGKAAPVPGA